MKNLNQNLKAILAVGMLATSLSGAAAANPYGLTTPNFDRPSVRTPVPEDNEPCVCEFVNGKYKCLPVGCAPSFQPKTESRKQSIQPITLPGDQFFPDDPPYTRR